MQTETPVIYYTVDEFTRQEMAESYEAFLKWQLDIMYDYKCNKK